MTQFYIFKVHFYSPKNPAMCMPSDLISDDQAQLLNAKKKKLTHVTKMKVRMEKKAVPLRKKTNSHSYKKKRKSVLRPTSERKSCRLSQLQRSLCALKGNDAPRHTLPVTQQLLKVSQDWIRSSRLPLPPPQTNVEDSESPSFLYLIFSRALWTWMHFPSTKNFRSEISGLSNSFFRDWATVK